jgi:hypothetical protein
MQEIAGFFIVESYVLRTTRNFRSEREVEELWEEAIRRITEGVRDSLAGEQDYELFIAVKDCLVSFASAMEVRYIRLISKPCSQATPGQRICDPIATRVYLEPT